MAEKLLFSCSAECSPSSDAIESLQGTPYTKLTEYSPDENRSEVKAIGPMAFSADLPPAFPRQASSHLHGPVHKASGVNISEVQDPFVTSSINALHVGFNHGPKLSPTAATFKPLQPIGRNGRGIYSGSKPAVMNEFLASRKIAQADTTASVGYLTATSVPDVDNEPNYHKQTKGLSTTPLGSTLLSPIGPPSQQNPTTPPLSDCGYLPVEMFSAFEEKLRYLAIHRVSKDTTTEELTAIFNNSEFSIPILIILTNLKVDGTIYVKFNDFRDTQTAHSELLKHRVDWKVRQINAKEFVSHYRPQDVPTTSNFEGQLVITATANGSNQSFDTGTIACLVKDMLRNYGEVLACEPAFTTLPNLMFRVEFFDSTAADAAVSGLNGFKLASLCFVAVPYAPDLMSCFNTPVKVCGAMIIGEEDDSVEKAMGKLNLAGHHVPSFSVGSPKALHYSSGHGSPYSTTSYGNAPNTPSNGSPFTPRYTPGNFNVAPYAFQQYGMQVLSWPSYTLAVSPEHINTSFSRSRNGSVMNQHRDFPKTNSGRQNNDHASGHHNVVDIERIRQGTDVRTTIMLRNIPNKIDQVKSHEQLLLLFQDFDWTQAMLKEIIDDSSRGKYDFMYLRIDFANNCNVGYAFINFEDPWFIIDFVKSRAGRRWNRFNSDKVAEVSYATIQGKDCLVQKFRNSSVMLEHPTFRPKIFHTGSGSLAGEEDEFPGPDNPSKMRRSVENAEHVGLFAPRAGQHFRDEQRRRRSQYDRGTRLAEMEDSFNLDSYERHGAFNQTHAGAGLKPQHGYHGAQNRGH